MDEESLKKVKFHIKLLVTLCFGTWGDKEDIKEAEKDEKENK